MKISCHAFFHTHTGMPFPDIGLEVESPLPTTPGPKSYRDFSTPMRSSHTRGSSDCLAESQGRDLLSHCEHNSKIWRECNESSVMIDHLASLGSLPEKTISTIIKSEQYSLFLKSVNQGRTNEHQFHMLATLITRQVQKETQSSVIYVAAGQYPLFTCRSQVDKVNQPTSTSLKIDFFTAKIKLNEDTKAVYSDCFDGTSRLLSKNLHKALTNTSGTDLATNAQKDFAMEDIRTVVELKSKTIAINESKCLGNLALKAAELLRYQFHRRFILGFLVAGEKIRVILFSREGVFIGAPAYFMKTTLLVRCIAATVSATDIELGLPPDGFFTYKNDQKFSIALESTHTGQKLFFDNLQQTQWPSPDILIGRGTQFIK